MRKKETYTMKVNTKKNEHRMRVKCVCECEKECKPENDRRGKHCNRETSIEHLFIYYTIFYLNFLPLHETFEEYASA